MATSRTSAKAMSFVYNILLLLSGRMLEQGLWPCLSYTHREHCIPTFLTMGRSAVEEEEAKERQRPGPFLDDDKRDHIPNPLL